MPYLSYINDAQLVEHVKAVLDPVRQKVANANSTFNRNVIDPFAALFAAASFGFDHNQWKNFELSRQAQKTLENHIGALHQKVLGSVSGWQDMGTGGVLDLVSPSEKIVAEVKNKYNTVSGGKLIDVYNSLYDAVMPKASQYHGYTAYLVQIVPKTPKRYNEPFTPSDNKTGTQAAANKRIRVIDGASFYALATGEENALADLYRVLPDVIEEVFRNHYGISNYSFPDRTLFSQYFDLAYQP